MYKEKKKDKDKDFVHKKRKKREIRKNARDKRTWK